MSKSDLQTRPIFHHKEEAIRSHILICFTALIMEKYLELTTKMALPRIRDLIWDITETHIQDDLTKKVFSFSTLTDEIWDSPLADLILAWKILPH